MPGDDIRFQELRQDIKDSLNEVKMAISDLRKELRTDYVGRGEYELAVFTLRKDNSDLKETIAEMKKSSRWTIGNIVTPISCTVIAAIVAIVVR
jgi:type IV secretory pathway VirB4 component